MRNLKKLLAVITVIAIIATLFVIPAAAAPSDVAGTEYESAVVKLNALGIITGRPDGKFYPNETISRAEFAAVIIRTLGYGTAADAAKGQTKFSDVAANYWASGYINLASQLGIITGKVDGTFAPNDPVKYEEAVTMVVRALGYEPAAKANGGYPTGYLVIASQEKIDKDAAGAIYAPASRGLVAKLVNNSLEVPLMIQVGYGTQTKFVRSGDEGTTKKTLIGDKLGLAKVTGTVASVAGSTVKIGTDEYTLFDGISSAGLKDSAVTAWVKGGVIYSLSVDSTIYYDFISAIGDKTVASDVYGSDTEIKLLNAGKIIKLDAAEDLSEATLLDMLTFNKIVVNADRVISITSYALTEGGVVTAVEDDYVGYTRGITAGKKVRGVQGASSVVVIIDGEVASYSDLEAGMYVDFTRDADGNGITGDYLFVASTGKIEGELTRAKDDKIAIDGVYAGLAATSYVSTDNGNSYAAVVDSDSFASLFSQDVVATLNNRGKIAYVYGDVAETTSSFYGYVTKAWSSDADYLKIFKDVDGKGGTVTYKVAAAGSVPFGNIDDTDGIGIGTDTGTEGTVAAVYKFTVNEAGDITNIATPDWDVDPDEINVTAFDENLDAIVAGSTKYYVGDAVMFNLENPAAPALVSWADIENEEPAANLELKIETSKMSGIVVFTANFSSIAGSVTKIAFVSDKSRYDANNFELELATATDTFAKLIGETKTPMPAANNFVVYVEDGADAIVPSAVLAWNVAANWTTITNDVYSVDGGFIKFTAAQVNWTKVASDVMIYEVNKAGDTFTEANLSDIVDVQEAGAIDKADKVYAYVTADGLVKAIFFQKEENE